MTFKTVNINSYDLIDQLDTNIFDGQFSSDVNIVELKDSYIDQINLQSNDICENEHGDLIIGKNLDWDSNYFGFNCYRIDYLKIINHNLIEQEIDTYLSSKNVKLAFLRMNANDHLNFCFHNNLRLMSTKLMYKISLENKDKKVSRLIRTLNEFENVEKKNILDKIILIVPDLFSHNRFIYDKNIDDNKAIGLYQSWIVNSAKKYQNNFYLLIDDAGELGAFCIINIIDIFNNKFAIINIIGSLIKGKNYGTIIIQEIIKSLNEQNISILYANVELRNYTAQNLYIKNGFKVYNSICEYHYWM